MTTRPVQVQRATLGKALNFHFGASIQRVVGLDLADPVFDPGTTEMRPQWKPRIDLLARRAREGAGHPASLVRRRRRGRVAGRPPRARREEADRGGLESARQLPAHDRDRGVLAPRRAAGQVRHAAAGRPLLGVAAALGRRGPAGPRGQAGDGRGAADVDRPALHALVAGSGAARHRGRRPARAARGARPAGEDGQAEERRSADPLRVRRREDPAELHREAAQDPRRDAAPRERPAAPGRPRRRRAALARPLARLRRQRGSLGGARRRGRGVPPDGARACRRRRSPSSGPATRSRSPRTRLPRAGRRTDASRSRSGTTRSRRRSGSRRSSSPRRSSASRSAAPRRSASCATSRATSAARA